jgi:hypothetical protein
MAETYSAKIIGEILRKLLKWFERCYAGFTLHFHQVLVLKVSVANASQMQTDLSNSIENCLL